MGIGITLATGQPSKLVQPEKDGPRTPIDVTVYDNEQDRDDIWQRYGKSGVVYPENLKRAFACWFDDEKDFFKNLDQRVSVLASDHVFIIDNVTSILPSNLTAKRAKKFYRHLKKVQAECEERGFRITFIVIAHTVKDFKNPITLKDLAGAGELSALSNRVIVIWPTKWGEKTKGLQVLKNRDSVKGDVKVLNLLETPYAHFEYDRTITMQEAIEASYQSEIVRFLKGFINMGTSNGKPGRLNDNEKAELYRNVKKFLNQGLTQKEIVEKLGVNEMKVSRAVKEIRKRQEQSDSSESQP